MLWVAGPRVVRPEIIFGWRGKSSRQWALSSRKLSWRQESARLCRSRIKTENKKQLGAPFTSFWQVFVLGTQFFPFSYFFSSKKLKKINWNNLKKISLKALKNLGEHSGRNWRYWQVAAHKKAIFKGIFLELPWTFLKENIFLLLRKRFPLRRKMF